MLKRVVTHEASEHERRPRQWPWILGLIVLPLLIVAAAIWIGLRAFQVESHLSTARGGLGIVRADIANGDVDGALAQLRTVTKEAAYAHGRVHDPVWWVASHIPYVGRPVRTVQALTDAAYDVTARALPPLAAQADHLRPSKLRPTPDTVDVSQLSAAAPALETAAATLARDEQRVANSDPSYIGLVADARSELLDQLRQLAGSTAAGARVAKIGPSMLGGSGARRYFVGFQNTAEARGTGGLIGGYAIVTANRGRLHVDKLASDAEFPKVRHPATDLDPDWLRRYRPFYANSLWVNTNVGPSVPDAAHAWASLWQQATGQRIDGAVALDPTALAEIIRVTGPIQVPGLGEVDADRVVPLIGAEQYRMFPSLDPRDVTARKRVVLGVAGGAIDAILAGRGDVKTLFATLGKLAGARHLFLESQRPAEQGVLVEGGLAGELPVTNRPFALASVFNSAGSKLDYYLDGSTDYLVQRATSHNRVVDLTVTLHNGAPANPPAYAAVRSDNPPPSTKPGDNRLYLQVYATDGAVLTAATLDGQPMSVQPVAGLRPAQPTLNGPGGLLTADAERGHPVFGTDVEIKRSATRTLVLRLTEPVGTGRPTVATQDTARPWRVSVHLPAASAAASSSRGWVLPAAIVAILVGACLLLLVLRRRRGMGSETQTARRRDRGPAST